MSLTAICIAGTIIFTGSNGNEYRVRAHDFARLETDVSGNHGRAYFSDGGHVDIPKEMVLILDLEIFICQTKYPE